MTGGGTEPGGADGPLTVLNLYALAGPPDAFAAAVTALAERVRREGHPGVTAYRFFLDAGRGEGRAVIDYAGPGAWLGHHRLAMAWPEMAALHAAAALREVVFLGPFTPAMADWLAASPIRAAIRHGARPVAGFRR